MNNTRLKIAGLTSGLYFTCAWMFWMICLGLIYLSSNLLHLLKGALTHDEY